MASEPKTSPHHSRRIPFLGHGWRAVAGWLRDVPIADPVDRRNAPMLQAVSLLLATLPTAAWLYRIFGTDIPWRPGETSSLLLSLVLAAVGVLSFVLIRRGRFLWAARQLLAVFAITLMLAYAATGFTAQRFEQPVLVIGLTLAGLVLGRGALWWMYGCVLAAFVLGARVDEARGAEALGDAIISGAMFLIIVVVIDRSVSALRQSLGEANLRSSELAAANARLHHEMAEREKVQEQLIHAQKVEAVGRLASGVTHDFGNLLGLILGYAKRGRRSDDPAALKDALDGVESAARRASAVSRKLLNFSRQDRSRLEIFDPAFALEEMRPMLRQLFDPAVELALYLPARAQPMKFDRAEFELIVLNIAANANHAMPDGGRFEIAVQSVEAGGGMEFLDTGPGIAPEIRRRIFDPFFTTKPDGEGTGLGLAVARDLIEKAGGRLSVRGGSGEGAVFRWEWPPA